MCRDPAPGGCYGDGRLFHLSRECPSVSSAMLRSQTSDNFPAVQKRSLAAPMTHTSMKMRLLSLPKTQGHPSVPLPPPPPLTLPLFSPPLGSLSPLSQVTPSLFLSGGTVASDGQALRNRGITCVVNATLEMNGPRWPGLEYLRVPLPDLPHAPLSLYFDLVADWIWQVSRRGGRTLVHCAAGISRSPTLCLAYLMKYHGQSLREAYRWVRSRRPIIRPNIGFWRQLIDYERRLFGRNSVRMVPTPLGLTPDLYLQDGHGRLPYWAFK